MPVQWNHVAGIKGKNNMTERKAHIVRNTNETKLEIEFNIDGSGQAEIKTGVGFMDHMLDLFIKHGLFDGKIVANGDTWIDDHHTTEDIGIVLGQAFRQALGDKKGIKRYGNAFVPMDESLAQVVVDLSDRPAFVYRVEPALNEKVGTFDTELVYEFFWKFALEARINLHIIVPYGSNTHHIIEAMFKAVARALDVAVQNDPRVKGVPSTKGLLG